MDENTFTFIATEICKWSGKVQFCFWEKGVEMEVLNICKKYLSTAFSLLVNRTNFSYLLFLVLKSCLPNFSYLKWSPFFASIQKICMLIFTFLQINFPLPQTFQVNNISNFMQNWEKVKCPQFLNLPMQFTPKAHNFKKLPYCPPPSISPTFIHILHSTYMPTTYPYHPFLTPSIS